MALRAWRQATESAQLSVRTQASTLTHHTTLVTTYFTTTFWMFSFMA